MLDGEGGKCSSEAARASSAAAVTGDTIDNGESNVAEALDELLTSTDSCGLLLVLATREAG